MVILMYMHKKFGGARASGLGDMDFQKKNDDFLVIFLAIFGRFKPFF